MAVAMAAVSTMTVHDHVSWEAVSWIDVPGHSFATRIVTVETTVVSEIVRQSVRNGLSGQNDLSGRNDLSDRNELSGLNELNGRNERSDRIVAVRKAVIGDHAVATVTRGIRTVTAVIATAIVIVTVVAVHALGKDPDGKH